MPELPFTDQARELLRQPNPAVIATLRSDGHPVSVATWYLLEDDDRILVNMDHTRKRVQHLRRDPRITLTALDGENWYTHLSIVGRVTVIKDDDGLVDIDRLSTHYTQSAYPDRESPRVSAWIEVERWHGWGALKASPAV
jgi:PPOX class probable F420-dependent enzyme